MAARCVSSFRAGPARRRRNGSPASRIRDKEHDGPGMTEFSYRRRRSSRWCRATRATRRTSASSNRCRCARSSPLRRTAPSSPAGTKELKLRGASWAGDLTVKQVDVSTDFGATWQRAKLGQAEEQVRLAALDRDREAAVGRLLRGLGARDGLRTARCSRTRPASGIRKATAATRCTASRCWSG